MSDLVRPNRRMPTRVDLGQNLATIMASPMMQFEDWKRNGSKSPNGLRVVMGYFLPPWQRGLVWNEVQKIAFIESAWRGINLGTYTVNYTDIDHPLDGLLIDGQQRMSAIQSYIQNEFPVLGWRWSEVTEVDRRYWEMSTSFASYRTQSRDDAYLRTYYDLLNFGGVRHTEDQRAAEAIS